MIFKYYLGIGSNIEPRLVFLTRAVYELQKIGVIKKKSAIYESQPWGVKTQKYFYNAVIFFHSSLTPDILLKKIKEIENDLGRKITYLWGPRAIDIDILWSNSDPIDQPDLNIPHKYLEKRKFVLKPLSEISETIKINDSEIMITDLIDKCKDKSTVEKLKLVW